MAYFDRISPSGQLLYQGSNPVIFNGLKKYASSLSKISELQLLDISPEQIHEVLTILQEMPNLQDLKIFRSPELSCEDLDKLAIFWMRYKHDFLDGFGIVDNAPLGEGVLKLKLLNYKSALIQEESMCKSDLIRKVFSQMQYFTLKIHHISISDGALDLLAKSEVKSLSFSAQMGMERVLTNLPKSMESLDIRHLTQEDCNYLAKILPELSLKSINIDLVPNNTSWPPMLEAIKNSTTIEHLKIQDWDSKIYDSSYFHIKDRARINNLLQELAFNRIFGQLVKKFDENVRNMENIDLYKLLYTKSKYCNDHRIKKAITKPEFWQDREVAPLEWMKQVSHVRQEVLKNAFKDALIKFAGIYKECQLTCKDGNIFAQALDKLPGQDLFALGAYRYTVNELKQILSENKQDPDLAEFLKVDISDEQSLHHTVLRHNDLYHPSDSHSLQIYNLNNKRSDKKLQESNILKYLEAVMCKLSLDDESKKEGYNQATAVHNQDNNGIHQDDISMIDNQIVEQKQESLGEQTVEQRENLGENMDWSAQ